MDRRGSPSPKKRTGENLYREQLLREAVEEGKKASVKNEEKKVQRPGQRNEQRPKVHRRARGDAGK